MRAFLHRILAGANFFLEKHGSDYRNQKKCPFTRTNVVTGDYPQSACTANNDRPVPQAAGCCCQRDKRLPAGDNDSNFTLLATASNKKTIMAAKKY
ncbi:MAG TPA: hypothetical protein VK832_04035 [Burkholderiaceae bacterium]|jgi:hypothetical protein|nr:hypothetical protein [Burkholderiaceae bacterium]